MDRFLKRLALWLRSVGIDVDRFGRSLLRLPQFARSVAAYNKADPPETLAIRFQQLRPMLEDIDRQAGIASGHYFHQDLWAARKIWKERPERHVDVGSRIDGFVAHLLTFMPVEVVDIRPLEAPVDGLSFIRADAQSLTEITNESIGSLSSLHAVEHFGLGRYGDPIAPNGHFEAMRALARVLQRGGMLYFSVPIGRERLEFNAHRILAPETIINAFRDLELLSFSAVDDEGMFIPDSSPSRFTDARFACGLFEFRKPL